MTDAPRKKRPWFQLHLSTCVVLMVVAGAFIWANVSLTMRWCGRGDNYSNIGTGNGFPLICYESGYESSRLTNTEQWAGRPFQRWLLGSMLLNFGVGLALLVVAALACEFLIRRLERKRAAQEPAP